MQRSYAIPLTLRTFFKTWGNLSHWCYYCFSFIFSKQVENLEKNVNTLYESNQNQIKQLSELKYKHDVDSLEGLVPNYLVTNYLAR